MRGSLVLYLLGAPHLGLQGYSPFYQIFHLSLASRLQVMINSSAAKNPPTYPPMAQPPEVEYNPYETEWFEATQRWTPRLLGIVPLFVLASSLFSQGGAQRGIPMALFSVLLIFLLVCFYIIISQMSQVWSEASRLGFKNCLSKEQLREQLPGFTEAIRPKLIRLVCYQLGRIVFMGNPLSSRTDLKQRFAFICKWFLLTLIQAPWDVPPPKKIQAPCDVLTPKKSSSSNEQAPSEPLLSRSSLLKRLADLSSSAKAFVLYLFQLRIQVGIAILSSVLFQTGQVNDVVLAIILDSDWKAYSMAIVFAVILSLLLWHTARYLTRIIPHLKKARNDPSAISSGEGLFSYSFELFLFWISWVSLALFTTPIAKQAYGSMWGGNNYHIFVLLISQAIVIFLWRKFDYPKSTWGGGYRWWFIGLYIVGFMLPFLFQHLSANQIPEYVGSLGLLFWGLSMILVVASIVFRFSLVSGVPVLSLLLIVSYVVNINRINDNHTVRLMPDMPERNFNKRPVAAPRSYLPSLKRSFYNWLASKEPGAINPRYEIIQKKCKPPTGRNRDDCENPYPVYVVSSQGGGIYAAYHAAKALHVINTVIPEFRNHLFAISSVSGGSIGSAIFVNSLSCKPEERSDAVDQFFDKPRDPLAMIVASMLFGDLVQRFYLFPVPAWDRSLGLELAFEPNNVKNNGNCIDLSRPFYESQGVPGPVAKKVTRDPQSHIPFLVLNTTEVDNGRRYLISPFRIRPKYSDADFHEPWPNAPEQMHVLDMRYSTAAGLSARFPLISPYGFFPEQKMRRFIDGGLYDNSGAVTAKEIGDELKEISTNQDSRFWGTEDECQDLEDNVCRKIKGLLFRHKNAIVIRPISILDATAVDLNSDYASVERQQGFTVFGWTALTAVFTTRDSRVVKSVDFFTYGDKNPCKDQNDSKRKSDPGTFEISQDCYDKQKQDPRTNKVLIRKNFYLGGMKRPLFSIPLGWKLSCQARGFINDQLQASSEVIGSPHEFIPCETSAPLLRREPSRSIPPDNFGNKPENSSQSLISMIEVIKKDMEAFLPQPEVRGYGCVPSADCK
jgi:hypothetical protein